MSIFLFSSSYSISKLICFWVRRAGSSVSIDACCLKHVHRRDLCFWVSRIVFDPSDFLPMYIHGFEKVISVTLIFASSHIFNSLEFEGFKNVGVEMMPMRSGESSGFRVSAKYHDATWKLSERMKNHNGFV